MRRYHDEQWGVPTHDDRLLFELLIPGGRAGRPQLGDDPQKRDGYRAAFDNFPPRTGRDLR